MTNEIVGIGKRVMMNRIDNNKEVIEDVCVKCWWMFLCTVCILEKN